jgi:undecaprenyl-diphosphatase
MTELAFDGENPDVGLLYRLNDLARDWPHWLDRAVVFTGEYGVPAALAVLVLWCWWRPARRQRVEWPSAVAGVVWSVLAAGIALLLSVPVRSLVRRPAPAVDHSHLTVLIPGRTGFSFVSGHATVAMAVAVGLFMVHRRAGVVGLVLAALEGFVYVFTGTHYPTDVIGGFALGTASALLVAPLAMLFLVPLTTALGRTRAAVLVRSAGRAPAGVRGEPYPEPSARDKDLAA